MDTRTKEFRLIESRLGTHLFVADGSRLYDIENEHVLEDDALLAPLLASERQGRYIDLTPIEPPPLYSISLHVAQICNMACGYCYADTGKFGGNARMMGEDIAKASVDRLIASSSEGADLVLGFMGGEPLLTRKLVHETTRYAAQTAAAANRRIQFSLTTNATLLTAEDAYLFAEFPFTVAVSIDGDRGRHDAIRVMNNGGSSYDGLLTGLQVLNDYGRPRHLSARVTVTPQTGDLLHALDHIIGLGFDEVGFAAVLVSPKPELAFAEADFEPFLEEMVRCGEKAQSELLAGRTYPFGNFETALQQIHRGTHRPYPCGAGAAYLSANAEGALYACHRLIDDPTYKLGDVKKGLNQQARQKLLVHKHVDRMEPCNRCWARYLCGGGCYHEVARRGRVGCDYIRGWLDFCLRAYVELSTLCPDYFASPKHYLTQSVSSPTTLAT